jgi:CHASE2 domain-containing sensor protein
VTVVDGSRSESSPASDLPKAPGPVAPGPRSIGKRRIVQDFFWGLAATALLVALNLAFEHSPVGEVAGIWGDAFIQNKLIAAVEPTVRVIDISDLAPETVARKGPTVLVTPRAKLKALIEALVAFSPLAIGVDIDFAPSNGNYADPDKDPEFFTWVIALSKNSGVPIYLAASSSMSSPPQYWLGSAAYRSIAASSLLPDPKRTQFSKIGVGNEMGPTMSGALASAALKADEPEFVRWPVWLANRTTSWKSGKFVAEQYIVDYSTMWAIVGQTFNAATPEDVKSHRDQFHNRVVIMGDVHKAVDKCVLPASVPGVNTEHAQPCVFVHASGVFTLLQAPLYRLTFVARILIDIALSVLVLGAAVAIRLYYDRTSTAVPAGWVYGGGFALAAVVVMTSMLLVRSTRLVWDDFALVIVAFSMHSSVEHKLNGAKGWFTRRSTTQSAVPLPGAEQRHD